MKENLIRDKLDAHDRWLERRYWCVEKFGEEDNEGEHNWWWDPLKGKFYFSDPNDELVFRLVWG